MRRKTETNLRHPALSVDWRDYYAKQEQLAEGGAGPTEVVQAAEVMVLGLNDDLVRRSMFGASKRTPIQ